MHPDAEDCSPRFPFGVDDAPAGYLLKMASHAIRRDIEHQLRPHGLTPKQHHALTILTLNPGITHTDLEKPLHIEKASVTSLINGMEKRGWLVRKQHPEDARIKQIFLTEEGIQMHKVSVQAVRQAQVRLNQAFSPEETEILRILLRKVVNAYS
ncbi:UNVERIFIED_CONTAM: DNA-binding MarR family transcriptional regulator [Brevibacillus sp. OAP136]